MRPPLTTDHILHHARASVVLTKKGQEQIGSSFYIIQGNQNVISLFYMARDHLKKVYKSMAKLLSYLFFYIVIDSISYNFWAIRTCSCMFMNHPKKCCRSGLSGRYSSLPIPNFTTSPARWLPQINCFKHDGKIQLFRS